jgi:hypothetical protein
MPGVRRRLGEYDGLAPGSATALGTRVTVIRSLREMVQDRWWRLIDRFRAPFGYCLYCHKPLREGQWGHERVSDRDGEARTTCRRACFDCLGDDNWGHVRRASGQWPAVE